MTKLDDLLAKKRTPSYCVVRHIPTDTYYMGHYGSFGDTRTPKIYNQVSHAKNALNRIAQAVWDTDALNEAYRRARDEGWTQTQWNVYSYRPWHKLTNDEQSAFIAENYEVVLLTLDNGRFKERRD